MSPRRLKCKSNGLTRRGPTAFLTAFAACVLIAFPGAERGRAALIPVPNASFEAPTTPFVSINIDSWQKLPKPDWYVENPDDPVSIWGNRVGLFKNQSDSTHIDNCDGNQAIWVFAVPEVGLFQDYDSLDWNDAEPTHDFDAVFEPGRAYRLTVGVIGGGGNMLQDVTLEMSLYYRDGASNKITVAATSITNTLTVFSNMTHLIDSTVNVPVVQPTDPWAGQHIGVQFLSTVSSNLQGGYWDLDNVRLMEIAPPVLLSPAGTSGQFQFVLQSEPGFAIEVLTATNPVVTPSNWTSLGTVTNVTGTDPFVDRSANFDQRCYRARLLP
jgi:hypothetical protein